MILSIDPTAPYLAAREPQDEVPSERSDFDLVYDDDLAEAEPAAPGAAWPIAALPVTRLSLGAGDAASVEGVAAGGGEPVPDIPNATLVEGGAGADVTSMVATDAIEGSAPDVDPTAASDAPKDPEKTLQPTEIKRPDVTPATVAALIRAEAVAALGVGLPSVPQAQTTTPSKGEGRRAEVVLDAPRALPPQARAVGHGLVPIMPKPDGALSDNTDGDALEDLLGGADGDDLALPGLIRGLGSFHALAAAQPGGAAVATQILNAVVQATTVSGPSGDRVEVILSPEELGRVQIDFRSEGGSMRVVLTAERPDTLDLLRRHGDQLVAELRNAGFDGASLSFGQWGASERQPDDRPQTHFALRADRHDAGPHVSAHPLAAVRAGLDLRF